MKVKDEAIKALETLPTAELMVVYDLILSLKGRAQEQQSIEETSPPYMLVREALEKCRGSLSEDVISSREDRV